MTVGSSTRASTALPSHCRCHRGRETASSDQDPSLSMSPYCQRLIIKRRSKCFVRNRLAVVRHHFRESLGKSEPAGRFSGEEINAARQLRRIGPSWEPKAGHYVYDETGFCEPTSPFLENVYFILNYPCFMRAVGLTRNSTRNKSSPS